MTARCIWLGVASLLLAIPACDDATGSPGAEALALDGSEWCGRDGLTHGFECVGDEAQYLRLDAEGAGLSGVFCEAIDKDCSALSGVQLANGTLTFTYAFASDGEAPQVVRGEFTLSADTQMLTGTLVLDGTADGLVLTLHRATPVDESGHAFDSGASGPVSGWEQSDWVNFCGAAAAHVKADPPAIHAFCTLVIRQGGASCTESSVAECVAPAGASANFRAKCRLKDEDAAVRAQCTASVEALEMCAQSLRRVLSLRGASATCESDLERLGTLPTPECDAIDFTACGFYPLSVSG